MAGAFFQITKGEFQRIEDQCTLSGQGDSLSTGVNQINSSAKRGKGQDPDNEGHDKGFRKDSVCSQNGSINGQRKYAALRAT